jgi:hypothetical protein
MHKRVDDLPMISRAGLVRHAIVENLPLKLSPKFARGESSPRICVRF